MSDFNVLKFVADNAGLNIFKALEKAYEQGKADAAKEALDKDIDVPSKEIIRCKDCKHWNLQVGNVKGDGLGSCDFHNVNLVTGEGFCYWADKRGDLDAAD